MIDKIIEKKKQEIKTLKSQLSLNDLRQKIKTKKEGNPFKEALIKNNQLALIGEIKRMSPSKGLLAVDFDPLDIAKTYEKEGIDAISVLTEKEFFGGDLTYIPLLKKNINIPILQKDFLIDEYQLYYSAYLQADAILLITSILTEAEIASFMKIAKNLGLDILVEVHTPEDVKKALSAKADIIGINNRNLETFKVDLANTLKLLPLISKSKDKIIISESGIEAPKDVIFLKDLGVDAILIGEAFMRSGNLMSKINEIKGKI